MSPHETVHHRVPTHLFRSLLEYGTTPQDEPGERREEKTMEFDRSKATKHMTPGYWSPEKGDVLVGVLYDRWEGQFGMVYALRTDDGNIATASHAFLQSLMKDVPLGHKVRIECLGPGKEKPGKNAPILYDVESLPDA